MNPDKSKFAEEIFSYQIAKNDTIFLYWQGRQIKALKGKNAQKLIAQIENVDLAQIQLLLAKATKNFKHGNEKEPVPLRFLCNNGHLSSILIETKRHKSFQIADQSASVDLE